LNLDGDAQSDLVNHGGIYKAVHVYSVENYDFWQHELQRDSFAAGQFGENFTVRRMLEDEVHIGDIFRVGGAKVEVTQPRVPCYKLSIKMGLAEFPKMFLASGRVGFMLRVLEEGEVGTGDTLERVAIGPEQITVRQSVTCCTSIRRISRMHGESCVSQRYLLAGAARLKSDSPKPHQWLRTSN